MKDTYTQAEVIDICNKLKRECAKMEMYHIIAKLNMNEEETRAYYGDESPEMLMFTRAILTIDLMKYL